VEGNSPFQRGKSKLTKSQKKMQALAKIMKANPALFVLRERIRKGLQVNSTFSLYIYHVLFSQTN